MIITEPESDEYYRAHKFPFLACEILSRENLIIVDKIFVNKYNNTGNKEHKNSFDSIISNNKECDSNNSSKSLNMEESLKKEHDGN